MSALDPDKVIGLRDKAVLMRKRLISLPDRARWFSLPAIRKVKIGSIYERTDD